MRNPGRIVSIVQPHKGTRSKHSLSMPAAEVPWFRASAVGFALFVLVFTLVALRDALARAWEPELIKDDKNIASTSAVLARRQREQKSKASASATHIHSFQSPDFQLSEHRVENFKTKYVHRAVQIAVFCSPKVAGTSSINYMRALANSENEHGNVLYTLSNLRSKINNQRDSRELFEESLFALHPRPLKVFASHYSSATFDVITSIIEFAKKDHLVLIPMRDSIDLLTSAMLHVLKRRICVRKEYNSTQEVKFMDLNKKRTCVLDAPFALSVLAQKPDEMSGISINSMTFERLKKSFAVTQAVVCFASISATMNILHHVGEKNDFLTDIHSNESPEFDLKIRIEFRSKELLVDAEDFLASNWMKITGLLNYELHPAHRWIERLVTKTPQALFCQINESRD